MNITESKKQLKRAECILEMIESAHSRIQTQVELEPMFSQVFGSFNKASKKIATLRDEVIPYLENKYRKQLYKATQI